MLKNEIKYGAVLSYLLIILNSVYGLIISPYLLSMIGASEYGVYKSIGSITASIAVLDLGIGGTMQRYIAKFNSEKDYRNCSNFSAIGLFLALILSAIIAVVCICIYPSLDVIYEESFTAQEISLAKELFVLSSLYIVVHVFENVINGIITGYNQFIFSNSLKIMLLLARVILYYAVLPIFKSAKIIIMVITSLELLAISIQLLYLYLKIGVKIRLYFFDREIFSESIVYTFFMFVQTVTAQVNSNLDNIIIGSVLGTAAVTVYSFGLIIFSMFQQLSTAISGVMLPTITNKICNNVSNTELEDFVIEAGKVQFLLLGSCLFGFALIGKEFIYLWLGNGFEDVWLITLILIIPATFELSTNVCLSILRAKNKMGFRTLALLVGIVINFIISIPGTKHFGYFVTALGTAASIFIASLVLLNIYYVKKIKINILRIYYNSIFKMLPPILLASVGLYFFNKLFMEYTWFTFICKIGVFVLIEGICILITLLKSGNRYITAGEK